MTKNLRFEKTILIGTAAVALFIWIAQGLS